MHTLRTSLCACVRAHSALAYVHTLRTSLCAYSFTRLTLDTTARLPLHLPLIAARRVAGYARYRPNQRAEKEDPIMNTTADTHVLNSSKFEGARLQDIPYADRCYLQRRGSSQLTSLDRLFLNDHLRELGQRKYAERQRNTKQFAA